MTPSTPSRMHADHSGVLLRWHSGSQASSSSHWSDLPLEEPRCIAPSIDTARCRWFCDEHHNSGNQDYQMEELLVVPVNACRGARRRPSKEEQDMAGDLHACRKERRKGEAA
jgi:hypothetical protein